MSNQIVLRKQKSTNLKWDANKEAEIFIKEFKEEQDFDKFNLTITRELFSVWLAIENEIINYGKEQEYIDLIEDSVKTFWGNTATIEFLNDRKELKCNHESGMFIILTKDNVES